MKLKKQFKIFIILFIILANIFAIKETSELSAKLEINTIAICDAQAFVDSNVTLQIFNVEGQLIETIVNKIQTEGKHSFFWNASSQSSGIYFYRIKSGTQTATGKCLLLK